VRHLLPLCHKGSALPRRTCLVLKIALPKRNWPMYVWTINEPKIGITANRFAQVGRLTPNVFYSWRYFRYGLNVTHWAAWLLALGTHWYRLHKVLG
jgi:hypothetical protein